MLNLGKSGSLRQHLIRAASGTLVLKIANTVLGLILAVVLARVLGVESFGVYVFCLSVVHLLTIPAMLGGQKLLVREVSAYKAKGEYHYLRGLLVRFRQLSFAASVLLALATSGIGYLVYKDGPMLIPFLVAAAIIPLHSAMQLQGAVLRGLRHILLGQTALSLRPVLVLIAVGVLFWMSGKKMGAEVALSAQLIASAVLVVLTFILLQRLLPIEAKTAKPGYETSKWIKSALPFVFASGMLILNKETSVVLLGVMQTPEDVGLFRVAQRGAMLIPFGLQAVNMAIAPTIAEMFAKGEKKRLQRIISKSVMVALSVALPVTLILILGGKWIIPYVFGEDYTPSYPVMLVLCLGQLVSAGVGSVALILNMAGLERYTAKGAALAAITCVVLNVALIPFLGAVGAAIATSASLMVWNILLCVWLYRKTGIISTVNIFK